MTKMTSEEYLLPEQLRIVLIGKDRAEKASVMDVLLRSSEEHGHPSSESQKPCDQSTTAKIQGENMVVTDTPDLCSADTKDDKEVWKEIKECVAHASGPHVFLSVLRVEPFTKQMQDSVEKMKTTFGKNVLSYTMVLFVCTGELIKKEDIDENVALSKFVKECKGGFYAMKETDQSQLPELLQKIKDMVKTNRGKGYTARMIQEAEEESSRLKKRVELAVKGSALAGSVLGGAVSSYFAGDIVGLSVTGGGVAGAALGCLGIIAINRTINWYRA